MGRQLVRADKGRDRYLVKFAAVADVLVPDFWDGSRNPVRYMDAADVKARGLDFDALDFEPCGGAPAARPKPTPEAGGVAPLSILEAKEGLAARLGVPVDMIEIAIKG